MVEDSNTECNIDVGCSTSYIWCVWAISFPILLLQFHSFSYFTLFHRKKEKWLSKWEKLYFNYSIYFHLLLQLQYQPERSAYWLFLLSRLIYSTFISYSPFILYVSVSVCLFRSREIALATIKTAPPPWPGTTSQLYCLADAVDRLWSLPFVEDTEISFFLISQRWNNLQVKSRADDGSARKNSSSEVHP